MLTLSRDTNGNKTLKLSPQNGRGFSVQTMGNLPETHKMLPGYIDIPVAVCELREYITEYGTPRQAALINNTFGLVVPKQSREGEALRLLLAKEYDAFKTHLENASCSMGEFIGWQVKARLITKDEALAAALYLL